ncbi:MAG: alpha/beta fold hydrolase, partial [Candidatus Rokubacteria bacterium]|nr:alpha/beta fold hydrolase [Candidatus Rokubacteria bacterium]
MGKKAEVALDDVEIYYELSGSGAPLVLVHEFSGSCRSWDRQVRAFSPSYSVLTFNCRGYPPSSVPTDPSQYSQEHSVADLRRLLDHLRFESAFIGGLSMGGGIALSFALAHPRRVRALILAGTGAGSDDRAGFIQEHTRIAERLESEGAPPVFEDLHTRMPARVPLLRKHPQTWKEFAADFATRSGVGLALTLRGVQFKRPTVYALGEELKRLTIPALIL